MITDWTTEQIAELVPAIFEARRRLGFKPMTWETFPTRLMCVVAELTELEEAILRGDHDEIALEISDVSMYLITMIIDGWASRWGKREAHGGAVLTAPPEVLTGPIRRYVVSAFEGWRLDTERSRVDAGINLELALLETMRLAKSLRVHLPGAISAKIVLLNEREFLNGGKNPHS